MIDLRHAETVNAPGCTVELCRVKGSVDGFGGSELFFLCRPDKELNSADQQSDAIYRAIGSLLEAEGATYRAVASETVFLRSIDADLDAVRRARELVTRDQLGANHHPARTEIEQPPQATHSRVEVLVHAIISRETAEIALISSDASDCPCDECSGPKAVRIRLGEEHRLYAGNIFGGGSNAYEQTHAMFDLAEVLLLKAGMSFKDVMRTWIYFPEMERDYPGFNKARREFFVARGVDPVPASTGIGARLPGDVHSLSLGLYACAGTPPTARRVMTTPTLNEAPDYGSDFSRGMRVEETNRTSLYVSGTASLDETGQTVHLGDFDKQVDRMLVNVAALLKQQGASFEDIVCAMTYVKDAKSAAILSKKMAAAGYHGFPNALVEAEVCRKDLLCETEALAVIRRKQP